MERICQTAPYRGVQGIYAIININKSSKNCPLGTPYVGQSIAKGPPTDKRHILGVGNRICDHKSKLRTNKHHNPKLQRAWNKYGEESFIFILLERVDESEKLNGREQFWMDKWDAYKNGYNAQPVAMTNCPGFHTKSALSKETVIEWIKKYKEDHNCFPHHGSGVIKYTTSTDKMSWGGLNEALRNGFRGFEGGSSLSKFISNEFSIINRGTSKKYTIEILKKWIERYYDLHGYYPKKRDGIIKWASEYGFSPTTWQNINSCLMHGHKGFEGEQSSLYKFIKKYSTRPFRYKRWFRKPKEVNG